MSNEGELKKRVREKAEGWEDTPRTEIEAITGEHLEDVDAHVELEDLFEIIDEACKEFPIKGYRMEILETQLIRETTSLEFDRPTPQEFLELMKWFLKWFNFIAAKE